MKKYPIEMSIGDPSEFQRLIRNNLDLLATLVKCPEEADKIWEYIWSTPGEFLRLIQNNYTLIETVKACPEEADKIWEYIWSTPGEFQRLIDYASDLIETVKACPEEADKIWGYIWSTPGEFQRLIDHVTDLIETVKECPEEADKIWGYIWSTPGEFQRLMKYHGALIETVKACPEEADKIWGYIWSTPGEFKRLIHDNYDLQKTLKECPEQADKIWVVLLNQNELKRFVKTDKEFRELALFFPQHKEFFEYPTLKEALEAQAIKTIQNAIIGTVTNCKIKDRSTIFDQLPIEMHLKIAAHTVSPDIISPEKALQIAMDYYTKNVLSHVEDKVGDNQEEEKESKPNNKKMG